MECAHTRSKRHIINAQLPLKWQRKEYMYVDCGSREAD
jgi:hypothetical protein